MEAIIVLSVIFVAATAVTFYVAWSDRQQRKLVISE